MNLLYEIFGWPLGWVMLAIFKVLPNYGLALIIFTLFTKLIMVPIAVKQQKGMAKMALFQPKLQELQKKYADDKTKLNEEMMKLYQQEGYNPMSGCMPMLIQFPILFGLIDVVYRPLNYILRLDKAMVTTLKDIAIKVATETNPSLFNQYSKEINIMEAVKNHSQAFIDNGVSADVIDKILNFNMSFFGLNLGTQPTMALNALILIPILSGVTSFLFSMISMRANPSADSGAAAGTTKSMMYMMPLFSVWIAFTVPAGVGFYWILGNIFGLIQSIILNKMINPREYAERARREMEEAKEQERLNKIEAKKKIKQGEISTEEAVAAKSLSPKEIARMKLAAARKRDAEKYGDEYIEVTEEDLK